MSIVMTIDAIIVAAGSGSRLGAPIPKGFVSLGGKPLFLHSVLQFAKHPRIDKIIIVAPSAMLDETTALCAAHTGGRPFEVVIGGKERWQSVQNGTNSSLADWVMIHDCARPFMTIELIDKIISASQDYDAVIAAVPEIDTIRYFKGDRAGETLDRSKIIRVQTPQMFKREALKKAFSHAATMNRPPTDEAMLMEALDIPVGIAWGDPLNFKITTQEDLHIADAIFAKHTR